MSHETLLVLKVQLQLAPKQLQLNYEDMKKREHKQSKSALFKVLQGNESLVHSSIVADSFIFSWLRLSTPRVVVAGVGQWMENCFFTDKKKRPGYYATEL